ncbi:response regulator [Uliginosibacterium sp. sgz301328]|uniref:response regulator n=1 Tax=Uliginosibacterium sp. sgz301328 TaxID=3243764 RepID=UPI00359CCEE0
MPRVLLVDDDVELCAMQKEYLSMEGFDVEAVHTGEDGVAAVLASNYDMIVLDVMMPGMNGIDALRQIRQHSRVPVVMLTARGDDIDRIVGLELGADDYVPKPSSPRELVARIRAILRRAGSARNVAAAAQPLVCGQLTVRPEQRHAEWNGEPLELTSTEFNLIEALVRSAGRVVSKQELSQSALGRDLARYDRSIDVHVSNLRHKLGLLPDGRSPIQTVRGAGFQLLVA